jgi:YD repeat-containing protein
LLEFYRYDAAGNMLEKFEDGLKTEMTYDAANQLSTAATSEGEKTSFQYDAAGRLTTSTSHVERNEGSHGSPATTARSYGLLDKVLVLTKSDGTQIGFDYYPDGQLAAKGPLTKNADQAAKTALESPATNPLQAGFQQLKALVASKNPSHDLVQSAEQQAMKITEELAWDGLALLYRNGTSYAIEPHISGGIPVASTNDPAAPAKTYYINDILGTTLARITPDRVEVMPMTAFGKPRGTNIANSAAPSAAPTLSPEPVVPADINNETNK